MEHVIDLDAVQRVLDDPRRKVALDGVHNFRDLGGYPALGGTTRWGLVYRADGLQRLTPTDIVALRERGLAAVIDLRTETEISQRGRFPVDQHEVAFHHLPVLDRTWLPGDVPDFDNAHDFLMWAYTDMIRVGADKLALALRLIAEADVTPVVFHCAAGKDRTGLLAALLLSLLGVPAEYIAADYGKTEEGMQRLLESWKAWARDHPEEVDRERGEKPPAFYLASPPEVMRDFLVELADEYGSVLEFVHGLGVTHDHVAALRRTLIEPA
jgi:protein-tyrosine phosphatase